MKTDDKTLIELLKNMHGNESYERPREVLTLAIDRLTELTQGDVVVVPRVPPIKALIAAKALDEEVVNGVKDHTYADIYTAMINAAREERG